MADFGSHSGTKLLELKIEKREWLVENYIRVNDSVMFVGNEKSGKSLMIMQLIYSLTSQHPLFDLYKINKVNKVTYIQLEGELIDTADRMQRMAHTQEIGADNFHLLFLPMQQLQENSYRIQLEKAILDYWKNEKPDVIIIDPLYMAFAGSFNSDEIVRKFIGNIRILKQTLGCTMILVHHTHKQRFGNDGQIIEEGDEAIFGSKFLKAWPDSVLMFIYDKAKEKRTLACNTQRSGDIIKKCILKLHEPDPLYFEAEEIQHKEVTTDMTKKPRKSQPILDLLTQHKEGLPVKVMCEKLLMSESEFYRGVKQLLIDGSVVKTVNQRPVVYKIKGDNNERIC